MADENHRQDEEGTLRMTFGAGGAASGGEEPSGGGRLVMPGGAARAESDADVVAGVRSLFGAGSAPGDEPSAGVTSSAVGGSTVLKGAPRGYRAGQVLNENGVQLGREGTATAGRPLPPTGVFHRPVAPQEPVAPVPEPEVVTPVDDGEGLEWEDDGKIPLSLRFRAWLAGLEWNAKTISVLVVLLMAVALLGYFGACGGGDDVAPVAPDGPDVVAPEGGEPLTVDEPVAVPLAVDAPVATPVASSAPATAPATAATTIPGRSMPEAWTIAGCKVETLENGYSIVFEEPAFETVDNISKTGMAAIKLLAAKLKSLDGGAQVIVTGYTDNVPMSKPTAKFKSNADIALARAIAAAEHLKAFAKNGALAFETAAGREVDAPYPNDTPGNRRRNRTATVRVVLP